ncbi:MAG TPA: hypothetical protein VHA10_13745 [Hypericibacter adhaerens]|jgi:3-hydroxymyristoyl/3-hydroxydecanoyl-(acyl carrier protein) dehydratase|uniref:ApeI family dehydratase n=1 Tax=Hypericibacter adhaerens TaxID=2602016 RepID=UPI001248CE9A|nr:hypothetical protein [Hypericibacter adhaerens]HWA44270.1 hypothetical protein [Hypericibacter adhaerens]
MKLPAILAERREGDALLLDLSLPEELEAFRGHFPDRPVLPGVVQIDWALRLAQAHRLIAGDAGVREFQVKFRNIIRPLVPLTLSLRRDDRRPRLLFDYRSVELLMSSGHLNLQTAAP